jgi:hypothetical protein
MIKLNNSYYLRMNGSEKEGTPTHGYFLLSQRFTEL